MQRIFGNLLATDLQRSISKRLPPSCSLSHTAFGYSSASVGSVGYLGLLHEPAGMLLLGNGHRGYWPELLRFGQPDALSPFGDGGMNSYAYCLADPVNREDTNGRMSLESGLVKFLLKQLKKARPLKRTMSLPSVVTDGAINRSKQITIIRSFGPESRARSLRTLNSSELSRSVSPPKKLGPTLDDISTLTSRDSVDSYEVYVDVHGRRKAPMNQ